MEVPENVINSILVSLANLERDVRDGFEKQGRILERHSKVLESHSRDLEAHSRALEAHSRILEAHSRKFESQDEILKSHDLELRKLGVLMEQMNDKIDTVIEGLVGLRESVGVRFEDHERRIVILERS